MDDWTRADDGTWSPNDGRWVYAEKEVRKWFFYIGDSITGGDFLLESTTLIEGIEQIDNSDTGYRPCACRDCFEIAIGLPGSICNDCKSAGCEPGKECSNVGAYGGC